MSIGNSFEHLQDAADATPEAVADARRRRDLFIPALESFPDVDEVRLSGSLARSTHKDPIHDVDLVCVYHATDHADWDEPGDSAEAALEHTRDLIKARLGSDSDAPEQVRRCDLKNHSVKCFLDDPDDPAAFTVDVVPALLHPEQGLWVPERLSKKWVRSDPQYLIDAVKKRRESWPEFPALVRVLKRWNSDHGDHMKSLVVEVVALDLLVNAESYSAALRRYFTGAAQAVWQPINDPAGLCGEIQPDLDAAAAHKELDRAATLADEAVTAEAAGRTRDAMCKWNKIFGDIYPPPPGGCSGGVGVITPAVVETPKPRPVVDAPQG